jgi:hypothetical protein
VTFPQKQIDYPPPDVPIPYSTNRPKPSNFHQMNVHFRTMSSRRTHACSIHPPVLLAQGTLFIIFRLEFTSGRVGGGGATKTRDDELRAIRLFFTSLRCHTLPNYCGVRCRGPHCQCQQLRGNVDLMQYLMYTFYSINFYFSFWRKAVAVS